MYLARPYFRLLSTEQRSTDSFPPRVLLADVFSTRFQLAGAFFALVQRLSTSPHEFNQEVQEADSFLPVFNWLTGFPRAFNPETVLDYFLTYV